MTRHVILVVEHDCALRADISRTLREENFFVVAVGDGGVALDIARDNPLSLIILDPIQLQPDGLAIYRLLRESPETAQTPLLMVITQDADIPYIEQTGLQANDYIKKPLLRQELCACVQTLLRTGRRTRKQRRPVRVAQRKATVIPEGEESAFLVGDLRIDLAHRQVTRGEQAIDLKTPLLFDLLVYLVRHHDIVLTRDRLLTHVWGYDALSVSTATHERTVNVHMHWLREILGDDPDAPQLIETVRGVGYRFKGESLHTC